LRRRIFDGVDVIFREDAIIVESKEPLKVLSSAPVGGGLRRSSKIVNLKVEKNFSEDPDAYFKRRIDELGTVDAVCLMTAADLAKAEIVEKSSAGLHVAAIVTAGVSNASSIGEPVGENCVGTINTVVLVDRDLTEGCMVNTVISATEAKCRALSSLDIRCVSGRSLATGTSSDAIAVASAGRGEPLRYGGPATDLGRLVGECVMTAVREGIIGHDGLRPERPLISRLEERGITFEDLVSTAMEMYVPHPKVPFGEAKEILKRHLLDAMADLNTSALIVAALRLDEDARRGLLPGLGASSYIIDPVNLVADEILGISIAMQIAGYYGLFEFYRFDRAKPGILKQLPPFLDDAIGALLAGASSRMYSEILKG